MSEPPKDGTRPRAYRFDAGIPVIVLSDGEEHDCIARNFSRSGLLLTGLDSWPAANELALILKSASGNLQVPVRVRPIRVTTAPDGSSQLAVEFILEEGETVEGIEFLLQRIIEGHAISPDLPDIPVGTPPHEVRARLEHVPLTHRIALAARGLPREREILTHDHNPQVLESLARNPSLLAHEARLLASSTHLMPSTLTILAQDGRWSGDDEIKILVVSHARVPVPLAEKVVQGMQVAALRRAVQRPGLHPLVLNAIRKRIR